MKKIDIYSHLMPPRYKEALYKTTGRSFQMLEIPALSDVEKRFRMMDQYGDYRQVITPVGPVPEAIAGPQKSPELCRIANDETAAIVARWPDRFAGGVAILPMNNMDEAMKEADRAVKDLQLRGIIIHTPINGQPMDMPQFMPLWEKMAKYDLPIWMHPRREQTPDYANEPTSKYWIWCLWGWPYETTLAMTRLVFSGIFDKHPDIKFITHHAGAMVPFFRGRIESVYKMAGSLGKQFESQMSQPVVEYFRNFYNDTAINGNASGLMCAHDFFGVERVLFGADVPYDPEGGDWSMRETIRAIEEMGIPRADKEKIFYQNARKLLRLPA